MHHMTYIVMLSMFLIWDSHSVSNIGFHIVLKIVKSHYWLNEYSATSVNCLVHIRPFPYKWTSISGEVGMEEFREFIEVL